MYNDIGFAYDDLKENEKAIEFYKKSIEANSKYCHPYYNWALLCQRINKS